VAAAIGVAVAVAAEARTAAEAPPLAGGTNLFSNSMARPDLPGGPFVFRHQLQLNSASSHHLSFQFLAALRLRNSSNRPVLNEVVLYRHLLFRHVENGQ